MDDELKDALAEYRPFLDELNRTLERCGEANTLRWFAHNPSSVRILQNAYRLAFQYVRDVSKLSPEKLVVYKRLGLLVSNLVSLSLPPEQRQGGLFDFGQGIPQVYVNSLLKKPNPFSTFLCYLIDIEGGRLCAAEIERRSLEHPELTEMLNYKYATPEREARKYLQERTLSEKVQLAKKYGLNALRELWKAINRGINDRSKLYEKQYGIAIGTSAYSRMSYFADSNFPKFEKKIWAELIDKALIPAELDKCIDMQCEYLERCVAIDYFGLSIKGGYSRQKHEADQAFVKMGKILKIKGVAWNYKDSLLGIGFSYGDKLKESEIIAQEGLLKGLNIWAGRDIWDIVVAGLTVHLKSSLKIALRNKLLDVIKEVKKVKMQDEYGEYKEQWIVPESGLGGYETSDDANQSMLELIDGREKVKGLFKDELDDSSDRLNLVISKANLTKRQHMVIDLTRKDRNDTEIALSLEECFGKKVTEGNVRQLRYKAIERLRQHA